MRPTSRLEVAFRAEVLVRQWQAMVTDDVSPYVLYLSGSQPPQVSHGGRSLAFGLTVAYYLGHRDK